MSLKLSYTIETAWKSNKYVILDTETTGLKYPAEIIQICVLDFMGDRIIDTLIHPKNKIPADATRIHGITDADVAGAPTWYDIREHVIDAIADKHLIIYNADYDIQMLTNSDKLRNCYFSWAAATLSVQCAMRWYADIFGEWDDYRQSNRWQKLSTAAAHYGISSIGAHDAYQDCRMTHQLINAIMNQRAAGEIIREELGSTECEHSIIDNTLNGHRVCRDCGIYLD